MTPEDVALDEAEAHLRALAKGAGIQSIANAIDLDNVGPYLLPSMLTHQLATDHALKMQLAAKLGEVIARLSPDRAAYLQERDCRQVAQLCAATARFTERYRQGLMSLARLERWPGMVRAPGKAPKDGPEDDPPGGGSGDKMSKQLLDELRQFNRMADPLRQSCVALHDVMTDPYSDDGPTPYPKNRGRLRHGNPSGDFLASPRCGAKCRSGGACRQPAMKNGRCRLHGGKSTGARTAAGLARCRTATLVHGHRSAEVIRLKSDLARSGRRLAALTRLAKAANRKSERPTPCPATASVGAGLRAAPTSLRPNLQSERSTPCPARLAIPMPVGAAPRNRPRTVDAVEHRPYIDAPFPKRRIAFG